MPGINNDLPEFKSGGPMRAADMMKLREEILALSAMNRGGGQNTLVIHGRTYTAPVGGGSSSSSSALVVRFEVSAAGTGIADMICQILAVPSGMTLGQMPGQIGGGTGLIHVCDPSGCFFNDPAADLLGANGWAQYMQPLVVTPCQEYPPLQPEWEVVSLCCTNPGC